MRLSSTNTFVRPRDQNEGALNMIEAPAEEVKCCECGRMGESGNSGQFARDSYNVEQGGSQVALLHAPPYRNRCRWCVMGTARDVRRVGVKTAKRISSDTDRLHIFTQE